MKKTIFILCLFIICYKINYSQKTILEKKYYYYLYDETEIKKERARYVDIKYKTNDSAIWMETREIKRNYIVKSYRNGIPVGKWINLNKRGDTTSLLDYDFDIVYDSVMPNIYRYDLVSDMLLPDNQEIDFEPPKIPGFYKSISGYMRKNITYPIIASRNSIKGKVIVQFIIDENGNVSNVSIYKGTHEILDKEAMRVFHQGPEKWVPAKINNTPVKIVAFAELYFGAMGEYNGNYPNYFIYPNRF